MAYRYVYSYYLYKLPTMNDVRSVLNALDDFPTIYMHVVEDYVFNYKTVMALYPIDREGVDRYLEKTREILAGFNAVLDKYNVDKEMRFNLDDLPDAIRFYRLLFSFMPEEECEKALQKRRERLAAKKDHQ